MVFHSLVAEVKVHLFVTLYPSICIDFQDTFQAHQKIPLMSCLKALQTIYSELDNSRTVPYEVATENVDGTDVFGTGLKNDIGEYNCFLNVIIQVFSIQRHLCCFTILFIYSSHYSIGVCFSISLFIAHLFLLASCITSVLVAFKAISR
jgi:hypothetical protein